MTDKEAIAIIRKEILCVSRDCDIERSCGRCDLVMPDREPIIEAYKMAIEALENYISLEDIKAEPYFWEKCPYYEPDMMFDGKDEYDCGKCKYKDKSVLEDIKAEIGEAYPYFDSADVHWGFNICIDIIDKHISELKGENNDITEWVDSKTET